MKVHFPRKMLLPTTSMFLKTSLSSSALVFVVFSIETKDS